MPSKQVVVADIGQISIYKRRNAKSIRLTIVPGGGVRVSMPSWLPYKAGLEYAKSKANWIKQHQTNQVKLLSGRRIGKYHRLVFRPGNTSKISARVANDLITVSYPASLPIQDQTVQAKAIKACEKALRQEAETLLPQRLNQLATKFDYQYSTVTVKKLKSRWGSCNHKKEISLSLFLMMLPWQLIDYVLVHELNHTRHLNHSPQFWTEMELHIPAVKSIRKQLKTYQPAL